MNIFNQHELNLIIYALGCYVRLFVLMRSGYKFTFENLNVIQNKGRQRRGGKAVYDEIL